MKFILESEILIRSSRKLTLQGVRILVLCCFKNPWLNPLVFHWRKSTAWNPVPYLGLLSPHDNPVQGIITRSISSLLGISIWLFSNIVSWTKVFNVLLGVESSITPFSTMCRYKNGELPPPYLQGLLRYQKQLNTWTRCILSVSSSHSWLLLP